jgi:hypothetical protein
MRRGGGERRLFWEAFERAYPIKATALLLIAAVTVVSCGSEGGMSHALSKLSYDSRPGKAPPPQAPAEKLHAAAAELDGLLGIQASRDLSDKQAERARAARTQMATRLRTLARQFRADHAKLEKLAATHALARLDRIEEKTAALGRSLMAALQAVPRDGSRATGSAGKARKLLAALSPDPPQQPLSTGFGAPEAKHAPASLGAGITPAYNSPTTTETPSDLPRVPEQADLDATPETKVSYAVHALAEKLGNDPVKIYGWVRNNVRYEPYFGLRKGADQTLAEKSGSDADQTALLIALLRDSGVHARFVQGTAELPAAQAANWLGVDSSAGEHVDAAPDILASGGIPTTQTRVDGHTVKVRFEHVWAEAYVPDAAYRGTEEQLGGKAWVPLDPSIKQDEFRHPVADFRQLLTPAVEDWSRGFAQDAQTAGDYGIVAPSSVAMSDRTQALKERFDSILSDHGVDGNSTVDQVVGSTRIRPITGTYLPSTTPFKARSVAGESRTLPASLNASISMTVAGADPLSQPSADPDDPNPAGFTFTAPTRDLGSKRITIGYVPASEEDAQIIDAYHGLLNAPTYAASLIPVLRVDGQVVARGHQAVSTGYTQDLEITYRMPGFPADVVKNPVYVGSLSAITLAVGPVSMPQVKARTERFSKLPPPNEANIMTDAYGGEVLSLLGTYYFNRNDGFDGVLAQTDDVARTRLLSGGIVATATGVSYIAGFPVYARLSGLYMDVDEDTQAIVSKTGDEDVRDGYLRMAGIHASSSESAAFSDTMGGTALSTADILRDAVSRGATILLIDRSNVGRLNELAHVPSSVKQEVTRAVNERDASVVIPDSESTIDGWTGVGYIVDEGSTIGYRISGGPNGAWRLFKELVNGAVDGLKEFGDKAVELQRTVQSGARDATNAFWDAYEKNSPFNDCNGWRVGGLMAGAVISAVFSYVLIGHLIGATFVIGGAALPAALIASAGPALFTAMLALAITYLLYAIEACLDQIDFDWYASPSNAPPP